MTHDKAVTDLIRRYLYAVEQDLPKHLRADITKELHSLIEDQLEDRARTSNQPIDVPLVTGVMQALGSPDDIARRFNPSPQYLVGPRFYSAFMKLIKIGLVVLAALVLLLMALSDAPSTEGRAGLLSLAVLGRAAGLYFQIGLTLFAEAVIVLAILERTTSGRLSRSKKWHPRDLPDIPKNKRDRVSVGDLAVNICLIVLFGAVLNLTPEWMSVLMGHNSRFVFAPITDFGVSLPILMINVWLALALMLKLLVLFRKHWTHSTRWAAAVLGLYGAFVLLEVVSGSALRAPDSVPQLEASLRLTGRLLYVVPVIALITSVRQIAGLMRSSPQADVAQE